MSTHHHITYYLHENNAVDFILSWTCNVAQLESNMFSGDFFHLSFFFVFRIMCLWMWSHLSSTELWMNMPRMLSINFQGHKHRSKLMSLMVWFYLWIFEDIPFLFLGSKKSMGTCVKDIGKKTVKNLNHKSHTTKMKSFLFPLISVD